MGQAKGFKDFPSSLLTISVVYPIGHSPTTGVSPRLGEIELYPVELHRSRNPASPLSLWREAEREAWQGCRPVYLTICLLRLSLGLPWLNSATRCLPDQLGTELGPMRRSEGDAFP
jgi:hypothetical protein